MEEQSGFIRGTSCVVNILCWGECLKDAEKIKYYCIGGIYNADSVPESKLNETSLMENMNIFFNLISIKSV